MTGQQHVETRPAALPAGRAPAFRVLVTGSRTWRTHAPIHDALDQLHAGHPELVLIHGACAQGVDALADRWATLRGAQVERHPAEWRRYKAAAGYRRNLAMVQAGADICLAFIDPCAKPGCNRPGPHGSHGAEHCARTAALAGIPVHPLRLWQDLQLTLEDA